MKKLLTRNWIRAGFTLLWDPQALADIVRPQVVVTMRELFRMKTAWPNELPGAGGDALVVAGLEGGLDALSDDEASTWLETDIKSIILDFQEFYQGQAALIMWVPAGRSRIGMDLADEEYFWKTSPARDAIRLPLGRCLWGGAEQDVARILVSQERAPDFDGDAYVGLHHPRIS